MYVPLLPSYIKESTVREMVSASFSGYADSFKNSLEGVDPEESRNEIGKFVSNVVFIMIFPMGFSLGIGNIESLKPYIVDKSLEEDLNVYISIMVNDIYENGCVTSNDRLSRYGHVFECMYILTSEIIIQESDDLLLTKFTRGLLNRRTGMLKDNNDVNDLVLYCIDEKFFYDGDKKVVIKDVSTAVSDDSRMGTHLPKIRRIVDKVGEEFLERVVEIVHIMNSSAISANNPSDLSIQDRMRIMSHMRKNLLGLAIENIAIGEYLWKLLDVYQPRIIREDRTVDRDTLRSILFSYGNPLYIINEYIDTISDNIEKHCLENESMYDLEGRFMMELSASNINISTLDQYSPSIIKSYKSTMMKALQDVDSYSVEYSPPHSINLPLLNMVNYSTVFGNFSNLVSIELSEKYSEFMEREDYQLFVEEVYGDYMESINYSMNLTEIVTSLTNHIQMLVVMMDNIMMREVD